MKIKKLAIVFILCVIVIGISFYIIVESSIKNKEREIKESVIKKFSEMIKREIEIENRTRHIWDYKINFTELPIEAQEKCEKYFEISVNTFNLSEFLNKTKN